MYNKSQFFWFFISSSPYTFDVMFSNLYLFSTCNLIVSKICIHYGILVQQPLSKDWRIFWKVPQTCQKWILLVSMTNSAIWSMSFLIIILTPWGEILHGGEMECCGNPWRGKAKGSSWKKKNFLEWAVSPSFCCCCGGCCCGPLNEVKYLECSRCTYVQ